MQTNLPPIPQQPQSVFSRTFSRRVPEQSCLSWDNGLPLVGSVSSVALIIIGALTKFSVGTKACLGIYAGSIAVSGVVTSVRAAKALCQEDGCAKAAQVFRDSVKVDGLITNTALYPVYLLKTCCETRFCCLTPAVRADVPL